jgi:hypothetical protein
MESNPVVAGPELPNVVLCPESPREVSWGRPIEPWEFEEILQRAAEILKLRARREQVSPE